MTDIARLTLEDLWRDVRPPGRVFDPAAMAHLPEPAQRYLLHAMAPGTPLASAVRLEMDGHIKLNEKWLPFEAEQVIRWGRGFIWEAKTKMGPLSIRGSDRFVDGQGTMRWKLLGVIPVMTAGGPDISRSAAGRLQVETLWLPSVLLGDEVEWSDGDSRQVRATVPVAGHSLEISLTLDDDGRLLQTQMHRWGNPEGGEFLAVPFGGRVLAESTFGGFTIPTDLRVGWYFGTDRFEREGEFWRATIRSAEYR